MTFVKLTSIGVFVLLPFVATAEVRINGNSGQVFGVEANVDGLILRSVYPFAFYNESGAGSTWEVRTDTIYLGKACDAFSRDWGTGIWSWTNAGFGFEIGGREVWFTRQDVPGDMGTDCRG